MTFLLQAPFSPLTPNLASGSDPSRGPAGNPVLLRNGFTSQSLIYRGEGFSGTLKEVPTPIALADCDIVISVAGVGFPDPTVAAASAAFPPDTVEIKGFVLAAAYDFGAGEGEGAGVTANVAASLGDAIANLQIPGVHTVVVSGSDVGIFTLGAKSHWNVTVKSPMGASGVPYTNNNFQLLGGTAVTDFEFRESLLTASVPIP